VDLAALRRRAGPATADVRWLLPVVAALLSWPAIGHVPKIGLDYSWGAGLHMARTMGLDFGGDVSFTYGPLGFLKVPVLWDDTTAVLSVLWLSALHVAIVAAVYLAARRYYGALPAFVLALLAGAIAREDVVVLAFMVGAGLLLYGLPRRAPLAAAGAGVVTAIEILAKPSSGGWALVMLVAAGLLVRRTPGAPRVLGVYVASAVAAGLGLWLALGQSPGDLWDYAGQVRQLVSGYSTTMAQTNTARDIIELPAATLLLLVGITGARSNRSLQVLWLLLCYYLLKEGFVRHDSHSQEYVGGTAVALLAMPRPVIRQRLLGAVAVFSALVFFAYSGQTSVGSVLAPGDHLSAAADDASLVLESGWRRRRETQGRTAMLGAYALTPQVLGALRGQSVHVFPSEAAAVWAYRLRWRPAPVFQSYTTYTRKLDEVDARRLSGAAGPTRVLGREEYGVDGRLPAWDAPRATLALVCGYQPMASGGQWWVLARVPWRCGRPRQLSRIRVDSGQAFAVPAAPDAHSVVVMRPTGLHQNLLGKLRALLFRGPKSYITLDGIRHPLVAATAEAGPLLVSSATSTALVPGAHQVSITQPSHDPITITFEALPVRGPVLPSSR
jgi:hypothetical protein